MGHTCRLNAVSGLERSVFETSDQPYENIEKPFSGMPSRRSSVSGSTSLTIAIFSRYLWRFVPVGFRSAHQCAARPGIDDANATVVSETDRISHPRFSKKTRLAGGRTPYGPGASAGPIRWSDGWLRRGPRSDPEGGQQRSQRHEHQDQRADGPQVGAHIVGLGGEVGGKMQQP